MKNTISKFAAVTLAVLVVASPTLAETLPPAAINALGKALLDEQHAEKFYASVIDKFGMVKPFTNIIKAERKHQSMVKALYEKYGSPIPVNPYDSGVMEVPKAPDTVSEACKIGVDAELVNRDLYDKELLPAVSGYDDITFVFKALRDASENNHLPAFQRCSARNS